MTKQVIPETTDFMYWLGVYKGKAREQERIIELLEGLDDWGLIDTAFVPDLIALIRGEN
jgi:hypothetical protein